MSTAETRDAILSAVENRFARDRAPLLTAERQREEEKRHDSMRYRRSTDAHHRKNSLPWADHKGPPTVDEIDALTGGRP